MFRARTTEYVVIGLYFLFMVLAGVMFRRFVRNFSDYFRSGCRATWWLVGSSVFMVSFSAWTFTGAAGVAYQSGIAVAVIFLSNAIGYFVNYLFTAKLFRQMRATTFPEVVRERFDTATQQFYVWVGVLPGILSASLTLLAVAVFTSAVFGFQVWVLTVILGLVVLTYVTIGGSWSVMATDFLQASILMPMAVLVTVLSLHSIGGFSGLLQEIHRQGLEHHLALVDNSGRTMFTPGWALAMLAFVLLSYNSMGSSVKYFAAKDGRDARKAAALAAVLMLLGALLWFIPPIVARLQYASLVEAQTLTKPAESAYAIVSLQLLPNGLAGMIVVAMFTATMSSLNSNLNGTAAVFTQDFYKPILRPSASDREMFVVGQIASLVVGLLIIGFAVLFSRSQTYGLFDYMLLFGSLFGTPMLVPMFLSLFVRTVPVGAAMISVLAGFAVSLVSYLNKWSYEATVFSITAVSSAAFFATLPLWAGSTEAYRAKVTAFFRKMHHPVDFETEVGGATDTRQLRMIGWFSVAMGLFMSVLVVLPNPMTGRVQILCVGGSVVVLGAILLWAARVIQWRDATLAARSLANAGSVANDRAV